MKNNFAVISLILSSLFLSSCIETIAIATISGGVVAARKKSLIDTKDDLLISTYLIKEFTINNLKTMNNSVDVMVNEQRVLLTGIVKTAENEEKANKIAWGAKGVKEVIDEIEVDSDYSKIKLFGNYFIDSTITGEINIRAFFKKNLSSLNYKITTINGAVYLLGVAENRVEMEKMAALVAKTKGVKKVVNHIILASDKRRGAEMDDLDE